MNNFLSKSAPPAAAPTPVKPAVQARPQPVAQQQIDGTPSARQVKPTKQGIVQRPSAPDNMNTSGMERAMGAHADKLHPIKKR